MSLYIQRRTNEVNFGPTSGGKTVTIACTPEGISITAWSAGNGQTRVQINEKEDKTLFDHFKTLLDDQGVK